MTKKILSSEQKKEKIAFHFGEIIQALGLDRQSPGLKDTPSRIAKMYVDELFLGLDKSKIPKITTFPHNGEKKIIIEKNIPFYSICEHHFIPIVGKVHIGYFAKDKIIGLSKLNRIVKYFSQKPQVQEHFTQEIYDYLARILNTKDVAVIVKAQHLCVSMRGIKHEGCEMVSSKIGEQIKNSDLFDLLKI